MIGQLASNLAGFQGDTAKPPLLQQRQPIPDSVP